MNRAKLSGYIASYKEKFIRSELNDVEDIQERSRRISFYQGFKKRNLENISYDDLLKFVGTLWASSMYGSKKYLVDKMIANNGGLDKVGKMLAEFVYGTDPIEDRWNEFLKKGSMFGPSYLSEILSYYYPDEFVIANGQVIKALEILEVPDISKAKVKMTGERYLAICGYVKIIAEAMSAEGLTVENLLSVDFFLWEVAKDGVSIPAEKKKEPTSKGTSASEHTEIIEKIIDIGVCLGFEADKEVKVATGAKLDAVWKVRIGNMGMLMYAFEVQSHGSIDSLILNLQKASNNPAVQRLIAVSDTAQLQKIKEEAAPIKGLELVYWDFDDVRAVHESLSSAFESINKLGLVSPDFNN